MKRRDFLFSSAFLAGALLPRYARAVTPCPPPDTCGGAGRSYSTEFPGNENPISENGAWFNLGGPDWTYVQTSSGIAMGTQTAAPHGYNDSYARLGGFSPNQCASAVLHMVGPFASGCEPEVELLLRCSDAPGSVRTYECNFNAGNGSQIVRWNGPVGDFTVLANGTSPHPPFQDGDVLKATVYGSTIVAYVNDLEIVRATDATLITGDPGIGFFGRGCNPNSAFALKSFAATSV
jgi:hypothetical protein